MWIPRWYVGVLKVKVLWGESLQKEKLSAGVHGVRMNQITGLRVTAIPATREPICRNNHNISPLIFGQDHLFTNPRNNQIDDCRGEKNQEIHKLLQTAK